MTRDELIEIIKDEVECNCDNGFMTGMGAAADAILAKLEREQATFNKANAGPLACTLPHSSRDT